jgi:ornithine carbamoyltransferase
MPALTHLPTEHLKGRDFLRVGDWSADDLVVALDFADTLKQLRADHVPHRLLEGRTVGMIFRKPSTRTRISFAAGIGQLGGDPLQLSTLNMHVDARGESIRDTSLVMSRYLDGLVIRTFAQAEVDEYAEHASIPVVNGLTDDAHPCQAVADLQTIRERFGELAGVRVVYVGDGNNVCVSLMIACAKVGASFVAATPAGYEPAAKAVARAREFAALSGGEVELCGDARVAATGADVLYTDVWTSMGQEEESERRLRDFAGWTIDSALVSLMSSRGIVLHCLPAHDGEEITAEVLYGERSAAWDQAENRLHAQKALLALIVP